MLLNGCVDRPRWADLQDTQSSQEPQASPPELRVSQPSQESVAPTQDLDGSREALRAHLERSAHLGCATVLGCTAVSAGESDLSASVASGDAAPGPLVDPGRCADAPQAAHEELLGAPVVAHSRPLSLQALLTTAYNSEASGLCVSTPPRVPAHKRNHMKQEHECRPSAPSPTSNKRPRNDAPTPLRKGARAQHQQGIDAPTPTRKASWASQRAGCDAATPTRRGYDAPTPARRGAKPKTSEEDLDRRREHRYNGVEAVKRSPEYQAMKKIQANDVSVVAPQTPDPNDLSVSKRSWEKEMMEWRTGLRQGCSNNNEEPIEDF